ncbi:MAG TPA: PEP/pyruvate-binding domain-containing protein [bacterium]|nr:PEP/pyruvate-binding domain-containing protein [bacterium]
MARSWRIGSHTKAALRTDWTGRKASRLALLKHHGIQVPDFVVLPTYIYSTLTSRTAAAERRLLEIIAQFCSKHPSEPGYAVRSSALAEDAARYSFAGQFKSMLHLKEHQQILDAIYIVLQSGFASVKNAYPGRVRHVDPAMAVILQPMIAAQFAGVLFTQNPSSADDQMLVEYVHQTGERLMEGKEEPYRVEFDRSSGHPSTHELKGRLSNADFTGLLRSLFCIGMEIEKLLGGPQDIEWAIDSQNQLWILQARPITASFTHGQRLWDENRVEYVNYFFVERFSGPVSVLGWSLIRDILEKNAFRDPLWFLGFDNLAKTKHLTKISSGIPFSQLRVLQSLYSIIPLRFISEDKKNSLGLMHRSQVWWVALVKSAPYLLTRLLGKNLDWLPFFHLHKWGTFNRTCLLTLKVMHEMDFKKLTYSGLINYLYKTIDLSDQFLSIHRWSITFADLYYELLSKMIGLALPSRDRLGLTQKLLSGLENNQTVLANLHLIRLQNSRYNRPENWDEYFRLYGHRSESLDISYPTWAEKKSRIVDFGKRLRTAQEESNNGKSLLNAIQERKEAELECAKQIAASHHFLSRWIYSKVFSYLLSRAQIFTLLRENQRDLWQRILAQSRRVVLHMAEQLQQQGLLKAAQDVFYLTKNELADATIANSAQIYASIIQQRKAFLNQWITAASNHRSLSSQKIFKGVPVSRGIALGPAYIAFTCDQAFAAPKDSVLIARSIDPAWTPVFHQISALVLEVGGVLSHASILAREFGVPSVTSVAQATALIKPGDMVKVDGGSGTIYLLKETV